MSRFRTTHLHKSSGLTTSPPGLSPDDISAAYKLTGAPAPHPAVAIVDAYDDPNAESDLVSYRRTYGLPACTTANGCFHKVNQRGADSPLPVADEGWGMEISLDLDAVSAACPSCHLMLVEADSDSFADLGAAVDTAVGLGAKIVSNSYGGDESAGMSVYAGHWQHPGTSIIASSGDLGFTTASVPAAWSSTIAVGGTTLVKKPGTARGWTEHAWSGAGSGCSAYVAKPAWQHDKHCGMRTVADVSADADPETGLAVYDTFLSGGEGGFLIGGGTSQSSPLIAAMIARSGRVLDGPGALYAPHASLFDVVGGSNGYCGNDYLCSAKPGYDAPTGVGTPNGVNTL